MLRLFATCLLLTLFSHVAFSATVLGPTHLTINPAGSTCPVTSGPLTLRASSPRATGISQLLVFFDATATTDTAITGNMTPFQDVTYTWNFGDNGASGTSTWTNGSHPGANSRNTATGAIAAHLYITQGSDTPYTATVTATDGTNTASCTVTVTAFDPAGAHGFGGNKTVCQSASGTPVAGSGGCPAGATVSNSASEGTTINASMNGKRVLFKCGDTFSGGASLGGTKFSIGAYGGCQGTKTNRPIMHGAFTIGTGTTTDGRVADLDFESTGSYALTSGFPGTSNLNGPMTLYNLNSNGNNTSYYWAQGHQWGIIDSAMSGMGTQIGMYVNYAQNNCINASQSFNCGGTPSYVDVSYQAVLGNSLDGAGATTGTGAGIETWRISACRLCVLSNNTSKNANDVGATLKLHGGNTFNTQAQWIGQYTEMIEMSDNLFTGTSGGQLTEICPQNGVTDERIRNVVVERNYFRGGNATGGRQLLVSAQNWTARDNVFNGSSFGGSAIQVAKRGVEWGSNTTGTSVTTCPAAGPASACTGSSGASTSTSNPMFGEIYNNTCFGGGSCVAFDGSNFTAPGNSSIAKNNMIYTAGAISNSGTGNTIANNSTSTSANPGFTNASGSFSNIADFKPTANFSGGVTVPVFYDAIGLPWNPWDLGALHH
jgi:hypothetical protein